MEGRERIRTTFFHCVVADHVAQKAIALGSGRLAMTEVPEGHGHELGVGCAERADAGLLRWDARRQGRLGSRHADGDLGRGAVGSHEEGHAADRRFRSNGTTPVLSILMCTDPLPLFSVLFAFTSFFFHGSFEIACGTRAGNPKGHCSDLDGKQCRGVDASRAIAAGLFKSCRSV